jgi:hypothetical protein
MAAGDLGDLVIFGDMGDHLISAIKGNLLMDWNELDMTPYTNIDAYTMDAQAKLTASCWTPPARTACGASAMISATTAPTGTWLPSPTTACRTLGCVREGRYAGAKTMDDLVPFLQALQDAVPQRERRKSVRLRRLPDWEDCV